MPAIMREFLRAVLLVALTPVFASLAVRAGYSLSALGVLCASLLYIVQEGLRQETAMPWMRCSLIGLESKSTAGPWVPD